MPLGGMYVIDARAFMSCDLTRCHRIVVGALCHLSHYFPVGAAKWWHRPGSRCSINMNRPSTFLLLSTEGT